MTETTPYNKDCQICEGVGFYPEVVGYKVESHLPAIPEETGVRLRCMDCNPPDEEREE